MNSIYSRALPLIALLLVQVARAEDPRHADAPQRDSSAAIEEQQQPEKKIDFDQARQLLRKNRPWWARLQVWELRK